MRPRLQVVEIMSFRLAPGVGDEALRPAERRLQTEFADHQPGLPRRTIPQSENAPWIVIDE